MSRTASFFLGMLCGMIAFVLIIAIALYCVVAIVTPNQISPQSAKYIGDLANKSLLDIYKELSSLYQNANIVKPNENGEYFSIADFEEKYNVNFSQALGITLTDEVKKMPVLSLFTGNGIQKLLGQTSITAVSDLVKIFTKNGILSDSALAKLSGYSVTDVISKPMEALKKLTFADILGNKEEQTKGLSGGLMDAFMGCNMGETLELLFSGGNLLLAIKSGPLSSIGNLTFQEIAGAPTGSFVDNVKLGDIINDNGSIDANMLIADKPLGELIGNYRNQIDSATITAEYTTVVGQFKKDDSTTYIVHSNKNGDLAMTSNNEDWYKAKLKCTNEDQKHQHQYDCYTYMWYTSKEYTEEISSMIYSIADLSISDLQGDGFNKIINKLTIREVLGDDAVTSGILKAIADVPLQDLTKTIDTLPLGSALGYERTEVTDINQYTEQVYNDGTVVVLEDETNSTYIKCINYNEDDKIWYQANLTCTDSHTHNARCYSHWFNEEDVAPTSYIAVIADLTFKDMTGTDALNNAINNMTFGEVINMNETTSPMLKELSDTKLADIGSAIDNIYMGTVLNLYRKEVGRDGYVLVSGTTNVYQNGSAYAILYNGKMYEAILTCTTTHTHNTDACYGFQWYDEKGTPANALNMKLANKKINELSSTMIGDIVAKLTIGELMSSGVLTFDDDGTVDTLNIIYASEGEATKWQSFTIADFVEDLIGKVPIPSSGSLTTTQSSYLVA